MNALTLLTNTSTNFWNKVIINKNKNNREFLKSVETWDIWDV